MCDKRHLSDKNISNTISPRAYNSSLVKRLIFPYTRYSNQSQHFMLHLHFKPTFTMLKGNKQKGGEYICTHFRFYSFKDFNFRSNNFFLFPEALFFYKLIDNIVRKK